MTTKELLDSGILHEANRKFFHPLGLALAVTLEEGDDLDEEPSLILVDRRDDPEGIYFAPEALEPEKAARVARDLRERAVRRCAKLGWIIQPISRSRNEPNDDELEFAARSFFGHPVSVWRAESGETVVVEPRDGDRVKIAASAIRGEDWSDSMRAFLEALSYATGRG